MEETHSELWLRYRPQRFEDVVGQAEAVKILKNYLKKKAVPHAVLFTGPSGTGKTTLAHIVAREMGCNGLDLSVVNCATVEKPIDAIRSLQDQAKLSPSANSKCRVWILEEAQAMSRATFARQAMLIMLESASRSTKNSYFFAATTAPEKLKKEILSRFKKIDLAPFSGEDTRTLLLRIAAKEKRELPETVLEAIIEVAGGSAREAVNQLDSAFNAGDDEEEMLAAVSSIKKSDEKVWLLLKALFWQKPKWTEVAKIIKEHLPIGKDREDFRHAVLKIAAGELLKNTNNAPRAYFLIDAFRTSWEHNLEAGLEMCCWEICKEYGK